MARLNPENTELARELIGHYPRPKSALIPLLHLAQEQDGYVTDEAMVHIAELVGVTPAEVLGTCTFYEMFKREPVGKYLVNICQGIACTIMGAEELIGHAEDALGIKVGSTTPDGTITLERAECQAACTEAPCLQVNYRYRYRVTDEDFDGLVAQLRSGALDAEIPPHGTLARRPYRQHMPADRRNGPGFIDGAGEPVWIKRHREAAEAQGSTS
ncbi:MAG: NAD(P)H-dependent oxidoreductase subunit E [Actinobacteria bacterium]|nr:NAD(P)H-dependent oxidoreductase subunit E [Actinomycetota bacterium]